MSVCLDHEKKRSASDEPEHIDKKPKVNDLPSKKSTTVIDAAMSAETNVVKATEVIQSGPTNVEFADDITDEELLEIALKLESKMEQ